MSVLAAHLVRQDEKPFKLLLATFNLLEKTRSP